MRTEAPTPGYRIPRLPHSAMTPEEVGWAVLMPDDPPLEGVTLSMESDTEDPEEPEEVTSLSGDDTHPPQPQTDAGDVTSLSGDDTQPPQPQTDAEDPEDVTSLSETDTQPPQPGTPFHRGRARACTAILAEAEALEERVRRARERFQTEFGEPTPQQLPCAGVLRSMWMEAQRFREITTIIMGDPLPSP